MRRWPGRALLSGLPCALPCPWPACPTIRLSRILRDSSMQERRPQVEGQWEFQRAFFRRRIDLAGGMAVVLKAGQPARLGLVGVDRLGLVIAAAGMGDMVNAAA